jgi:hypothetical protein
LFQYSCYLVRNVSANEKGGGEASVNYRGPAFRNGARNTTMLIMVCFSR